MKLYSLSALVFVLFALFQCGVVQETIQERQEVLGVREVESNFAEARQIQEVELWKDNPSKIVNVYLLNPVTGGLLVDPIQCKGVPNSSTESLEPNQGVPYYDSGPGSYWRVPIDGYDTGTTEMAGKDGTFGEPVGFRYCLSVDGQYHDWPSVGLPYLVSSAFYNFQDVTIKRDFETEARLIKAEEIIKRGGCVNIETLEEQPCPVEN